MSRKDRDLGIPKALLSYDEKEAKKIQWLLVEIRTQFAPKKLV